MIAFSNAETVQRTRERRNTLSSIMDLPNASMSPLLQAAIEVTEEAIYNSLCMAVTVTGYNGRTVEALPLDRVSAWVHATVTSSPESEVLSPKS